MHPKILFKQAFSSIFSNKLRSLLSLLGIVIGISSVIIMLAVGEGAKQSILESFDNIDNLISIEKNYATMPDPSEKKAQTPIEAPVLKNIFTPELAQEIPQKVYGVDSVMYTAPLWTSCVYKSKDCFLSILGTSKGYFQVKDYETLYGHTFTKKEYADSQKVIVLGYNAVWEIFHKQNPLGKKISLGGSNFTVIGVLKKQNKWQADGYAFIPYTTSAKVFGSKDIEKLEVFASKFLDIYTVKKNLQYFLYLRNRAPSPSQVDFRVSTNEDALKQVDEIIGKMRILLAAIGSIALIVGGIGIMNIMLVSVTERTREIGIKKAIGATKLDIMSQFLIEAVVLSLLGCVIAIGVSYGIAYAIKKFLSEFTPIITPDVILLSSGVAIAMGILFGLLPAWKAAKLKTIDALRYE